MRRERGTETNEAGLNCKYCQLRNVIKYGVYKDTQYYFCKDCKRKFSNPDAIPKMQYPTSKIAEVLHMYYEGMSLNEIRRNLIQQHNNYISDVTAWNWVHRFSKLAIIHAGKYKPDVSSVWIACETMKDIDGKIIWFWDIIDTKTLFLIASHMSYTRTTKDAQQLMRQAYDRTDKIPEVIYTDKLRAYLNGIELTFVRDSIHKQSMPYYVECYTKLIERFYWTIESRAKVMRGLHTVESARLFMDGWIVHFNYFIPRTSLKDKTPAMVAGVKAPFCSWKEVCEQPFEITARIPMRVACEVRKRPAKHKSRTVEPVSELSQVWK